MRKFVFAAARLLLICSIASVTVVVVINGIGMMRFRQKFPTAATATCNVCLIHRTSFFLGFFIHSPCGGGCFVSTVIFA